MRKLFDFMGLIKNKRKEQGLTQEDIAKILDISYQAYAHYEKGRRQPDVETVLKLCNYFYISFDAFFNNETESLSQEHKQLINYYEQCDEIDKVRILAYAEAVAENNKEVYKDVDKQQKPLKKVK